MNRRITITILACLVGLWSAAASAQGKFNPNQVTPIVKQPPIIDPNVIDPKVKLLPPMTPPADAGKLPPMTPPAAPTVGPVIEPIVKPPIVKLPPTTSPADAGKLPPTISPEVKLPPIIDPKVIDPKVKLPPMTPPAAPTVGPIIEPIVKPPIVKLPPTISPEVKLPPGTLPADAGKLPPTISPEVKLPPETFPVDPTGGHIGEHEPKALEAIGDAARAGKLADQESGLDHEMGAGPGDDRPWSGADVDMHGFGKDDGTVMQRFCKTKSATLFPGLCPGRGGDLPSDGDLSGFYNTERPVPSATDPGGAFALDGPSAGGGVPSGGGQASDDKGDSNESSWVSPDGMHSRYSWTDRDGMRHELLVDETSDGVSRGNHEVRNKDGTWHHSVERVDAPDRSPGARRGDRVVTTTYRDPSGQGWGRVQFCRGSRCSQPGESGYGQMKARPWFCARNPEAEGCKPTAPGSHIDPANPDGEGTPTGPRPATHRLGREAVSDPGPADSEIRGTTGGGSRPLDMKDPANPDDPDSPGRPPDRPR